MKNIESGLWFYNWRPQRTIVMTLEECLLLHPGLMMKYLVRSRAKWWPLGRSGMSWWNNRINLVFWFGTSFSPSAKFFPSSYTHRSTDFDYDTGKSPAVQEHPMFWSFWIEGDTPALTHTMNIGHVEIYRSSSLLSFYLNFELNWLYFLVVFGESAVPGLCYHSQR